MHTHPSQKLPTDRRALLFRVSSAEFAANGFNQASLNRIISEIRMSKSSFYHYFKNKTDLFQQTLDQAITPVLEQHGGFDIQTLTAENLWPKLLHMAGELIDLINVSPDLITIMRMFYRSMDDADESVLVAEKKAELTQWLTLLLRRGQELQVFRDDLPDSLMIDILMSMGMSIDRWMLARWENTQAVERIEISQKTFELFVRVLAKHS
ncbi:MAG: AcrR family transcriptional regulator [Paracoccaceae bacterium]|jgi:AcrR family transcriptional regulator